VNEQPTRGVSSVLDAIEDAVTGARSMPMSASVIVNRAELLDLVAQVRQALPDQLAAADRVIAAAEAHRATARADAERIVADAQAQAARLVDADRVVAEARATAEQIVRDAQAEAADLRRDADDYCDRSLAGFEIDLSKLLNQVQAGRTKLAGRLDTGR